MGAFAKCSGASRATCLITFPEPGTGRAVELDAIINRPIEEPARKPIGAVSHPLNVAQLIRLHNLIRTKKEALRSEGWSASSISKLALSSSDLPIKIPWQ